ncbi:TonB-dependent receptor [Parasphingopyxis lamellibrachiae]|uniref:TonB-dependent receptor n=1 Tax=Parasphingopyxis lamellibrachiae TaxID=680125 RepID=UPI0011C04DF1|nr:TonB-dependent receptor [Parasphingopyxis lamellibrachiae]
MSKRSKDGHVGVKLKLLTGAVFFSPFLAMPAVAQNSQNETESVSEDTGGLSVIIVTAQRRDENLQDVPAAVTAFGAEDITRFGFTDPSELTAQTPGLQIRSSNGQTKPNVFLRGIGTNDFNVSASGAVGFYADEVYQGLQSGQLFQMFDLDRVEVLRGPQGTLYGRNTTGGAVNFFARQPDGDFAANASATYGRFDQFDIEAGVQAPLAGDVLSMRLAGVYRSNNGSGVNQFTGERVGDSESWALRGLLRLQPDDNQDWLLNVHGGRLTGDGPRYHFQRVPNGLYPDGVLPIIGVTAPFSPMGGYWDGEWDLPQDEEVESFGISLNGEIYLGGPTLHSVTGYEAVDAFVRFDSDGTPLNYVNVDFGDESWQFSQELRLDSDPDKPLTWIIGGYFYSDRVRANNSFDVGRFARELFGAIPDITDPAAPIVISQLYTQRTRSYAAFGSASYHFNDAVTLTAGLRYTRDRKTLDYFTTADSALLAGIPSLIDVERRRSWDALTGNVILEYQAADNILLYTSYNRGFKSGQFNASPFFEPMDVNSANPETVDAFEVGFKSQLANNRVRLNVSAFYNEFSDLQVFQFIPDATTGIPTSRYSNAGAARVSGLEFEIDARPMEALSLRLSGALLDAEYTRFIAAVDDPTTPQDETVDLSGNRLSVAPRFNLSGSVDYTISINDNLELVPSYDFTYNSRKYFTPENASELSQRRFWVHNASIALREADGRYSLTAWIRNLSGTRYNDEIFPLSDFGLNGAIRGARQSYGITLSYRFE